MEKIIHFELDDYLSLRLTIIVDVIEFQMTIYDFTYVEEFNELMRCIRDQSFDKLFEIYMEDHLKTHVIKYLSNVIEFIPNIDSNCPHCFKLTINSSNRSIILNDLSELCETIQLKYDN